MKKTALLCLAFCLILSLFACGKDTAPETTVAPIDTTASAEAIPTAGPETIAPTQEAATATQSEATPPAENHRAVDVQLLEQLTAEDTFGVKIVKTEKMEGIFRQGIYENIHGNDGVVLTLLNNSGTKITKVTVLALATNRDRVPVTLSLSSLTRVTLGDENFAPEVAVMVCDLELENGGTYDQGAIQCHFDKVENISVFVYSYTDANGNEIINENCVQWLTNTMAN